MAYDNMTSRSGSQPLVKEHTENMLLTTEEKALVMAHRSKKKADGSKEGNTMMNNMVRGAK